MKKTSVVGKHAQPQISISQLVPPGEKEELSGTPKESKKNLLGKSSKKSIKKSSKTGSKTVANPKIDYLTTMPSYLDEDDTPSENEDDESDGEAGCVDEAMEEHYHSESGADAMDFRGLEEDAMEFDGLEEVVDAYNRLKDEGAAAGTAAAARNAIDGEEV